MNPRKSGTAPVYMKFSFFGASSGMFAGPEVTRMLGPLRLVHKFLVGTWCTQCVDTWTSGGGDLLF